MITPCIVCLLVMVSALPIHAHQPSLNDTSTLTLFVENDITNRSDKWYTSGVKLTWISPDLSGTGGKGAVSSWVNSLMKRLPLMKEPGLLRTFSVSFGQNIYTPKDKLISEPVEDDRPYAGISYLALGLHGRNARRMDTVEFDIGIVGPHSYAEQTQRIAHKLTRYYQPKGWDNQLKDEPILNIYLDRKWKVLRSHINGAMTYDIIPYAGLAAGNAFTAANAGSEVRVGWNIPNDYGTFLIRPGSDSNAPIDDHDPGYDPASNHLGAHFFTGIDAYAIERDIFLDGNTFKDSQSVDKEPFVANLIAGIGVTCCRFKLTLAQVYRTREFKTQDKGQMFCSLSVSYSH